MNRLNDKKWNVQKLERLATNRDRTHDGDVRAFRQGIEAARKMMRPIGQTDSEQKQTEQKTGNPTELLSNFGQRSFLAREQQLQRHAADDRAGTSELRQGEADRPARGARCRQLSGQDR